MTALPRVKGYSEYEVLLTVHGLYGNRGTYGGAVCVHGVVTI